MFSVPEFNLFTNEQSEIANAVLLSSLDALTNLKKKNIKSHLIF